jgi:hypothetical protein
LASSGGDSWCSSDLPRYGRATENRTTEAIGNDGNKNVGAEEGTLRDGTLAFLSNNVKNDAYSKQAKTLEKMMVPKFCH